MSDYDRTMELVESAQNSAGKSEEQFAKTSDTVSYKLNTLKNTWEQVRLSFMNSDFLKGVLDSLNDLLEKILSLDLTLILGIAAVGLTLGKTIVTNFLQSLKLSSSTISATINNVFTKATSGVGSIIGKAFTGVQEKKAAQSVNELLNSSLMKTSARAAVTDTLNNATYTEKSIPILGALQALEDAKKLNAFNRNKGNIGRTNWTAQELLDKNQERYETATTKTLSQADTKVLEMVANYQEATQKVKNLEAAIDELNKKLQSLNEKLVEENSLEAELLAKEKQINAAYILQRQEVLEVAKALQASVANQAKQNLNSTLLKQFEAGKTYADENTVGDASVVLGGENGKRGEKAAATSTRLSNLKSGMSTALNQGLSSAVTGALISVFSGGDIVEALETAGIMALTSALPLMITTAITALTGTVVGAVIGWIAIIGVVIVAAIYAWNKYLDSVLNKINEARKAEIDRIENIEDKSKELAKTISSSLSNISQNSKKYSTFETDYNRYEYLSNKDVLTESESDELTELFDTITESDEYEDLILSYDEETEEINFVNDALSEFKETIDEANESELNTIKSSAREDVEEYDFVTSKYKELSTLAGIFENLTASGSETSIKAEDYNITEDYLTNDANSYLLEDNIIEGILNLPTELKKAIANSDINISYDALSNSGTTEGIYALREEMEKNGISLLELVETSEEQSEILAETYKEKETELLQEDTASVYLAEYEAATGESMSSELAYLLTGDINSDDKLDIYKDAAEGLKSASELKKGLFTTRGGNLKDLGGKNGDDDRNAILKEFGYSDDAINALTEALNGMSGSVSDLFSSGSNMKTTTSLERGSEVEQDFAAWLEENEYTEDYNKNRKKALESTDYLTKYYTHLISENLDLTGDLLTEEFLSDNLGLLTRMLENLIDNENEYTDEQLEALYNQQIELLNNLAESATDSETAEGYGELARSLEERLEEEKAQIDELNKELLNYNFSGDILDTLTQGAKNSLISMFNTLSDTYSDEQLKDIGDIYSRIIGNLDKYDIDESLEEEVTSVLGSIDLTKTTAELKGNMSTYVQSLVDYGVDREEAEKLILNYIDGAAEALKSIPQTAEAIKNVFETTLTELKAIKDDFGDVQDAIDDFYSTGTWSTDDIDIINEAGFTEAIEFDDRTGRLSVNMDVLYKELQNKLLGEVDETVIEGESLSLESQIVNNNLSDWNYEGFGQKVKDFIWGQLEDQGLTDGVKESSFNSKDITGMLTSFSNLGGDTVALGEKFRNLSTSAAELDAEEAYNVVTLIGLQGSAEDAAEELDKLAELNLEEIDKQEAYNILYAEELYKQAKEDAEAAQEEYDKNQEDLATKNKELTRQERTIEKAETSKDEAWETYLESIHGSWDYDSGIDAMLNFTNSIEDATDKIDDLKDALEEVTTVSDAIDNLNEFTELNLEALNLATAEKEVAERRKSDLQSTIANDETLSKYLSIDEDGNLTVDMSFENADMPDAMKDYIKDIETEYLDAVEDSDSADKTIKEREEAQKELYDEIYENIAEEEEKIADILKENYEELIEDKEDYYDALKEADEDYIDALRDAIEKQRELRDLEDKYEDLATKEKKLSLMSRDTSGANLKEVQELEEEVEDDRQELLDDKIDTLIDSLEEMYENEQEAREAEIEALNANTEAINWNAQAAELINSWGGDADARSAWYLENDSDAENLTPELTVNYLNGLESGLSAIVTYMAAVLTDFQEALTASTSALLTEVDSTVDYYTTKYDELLKKEQETAEETKTDAWNAYLDACESYDDAVEKKASLEKELSELVDKEAELQTAAEETAAAIEEGGSTFEATKEIIVAAARDMSEEACNEMIAGIASTYGVSEDTVRGWVESSTTSSNNTTTSSNNTTTSSNNTTSSTKTGTGEAVELVNKAKNKIENTKLPSTSTKDEEGNAYNIRIETKDGQFYYGNNLKTMETLLYNNDKKPYARWYLGSTGAGYKKSSEDDTLYVIDDNGKEVPLTWEYLDTHMKNAWTGANYLAANVDHYYKQGGLVDYTGIAQVDGTPSKPEAFLNAEQTEALKQLASNFTNYSSLLNTVQDFYNNYGEQVETNTQLTNNTSNVGDTSVEVHINIENISSDVDVDEALDKMENRLAEVYNYAGSSVILSK